MIGLDMMMACAPNVAPAIMERIIHVGSRGDPLALNANAKWMIEHDKKGQPIMVTGKDGQPRPKRCKVVFKWSIEAKTKQDAVTVAYAAMADGFTVDMSYMQVSSNNLSVFGFAVEDMFDDYKDLAAGANVLSVLYVRVLKEYPDPQMAFRAALSAYNIGDFNKGYPNGHLVRYEIGNPAVNVSVINSYMADTTVFARQPPKKEEAMSIKEEVSSTQQIAEPAKAVAPRADPVVNQSQEDGATPGVQVEHTMDAAEANDAFHETAMSESDAWRSSADLADDPSGTVIMLKGKIVRPAAPCSAADLAKAQPVKGGNRS